MFQFRRFPTYTYGFSVCYMDMTPCGFPHSEICGSKIVCISPQLFAAYHVFLRSLMPRHSPCALCSLTLFDQLLCVLQTRFLSQNCSLFSYPLNFSFFAYLIFDFLFLTLYFRISSLFNFQDTFFCGFRRSGGHKWTRTTDLTLIRRAL